MFKNTSNYFGKFYSGNVAYNKRTKERSKPIDACYFLFFSDKNYCIMTVGTRIGYFRPKQEN